MRSFMNQLPDPQGQSSRAVAEVGESALEGVVEGLQRLPGLISQQQGSVGEPGFRPADVTMPISMLLQLPDALLAQVAQQAGNGVRLVCTQLRDTYGDCPGSTLKQPLSGYEVDHLALKYQISYHLADDDSPVADTHSSRLWEALQAAPNPTAVFPINPFLRQYAAKWPGRVTHLELSTVHAVSDATLQTVSKVLPGLRALKCGWWPELASQGRVPARLPCLSALTGLSLLCTSHDILASWIEPGDQLQRLPAFAPNLRSLSLDLRHKHAYELPDAMQALCGQLTHLSLRLDGITQRDDEETDYVLDALEHLTETLKSLELLSPATWLGEDFLPVLHSMQHLTSLVWTINDMVELTEADLPRWLEVGQLQYLVLGPPNGKWHPRLDVGSQANLQALCSSFGDGVSLQLVSLTLPLLTMRLECRERDPPRLPDVKAFLGCVQQACPGLTSLQVGCQIHYQYGFTCVDELAMNPGNPGSDEMWHLLLQQQPAHQQWLEPVSSMQMLQHLTLGIDAADMRQLAWLAPLPQLTSLLLYVSAQWPADEDGRGDVAATTAVQTLQGLVLLQHLSIELVHEVSGLSNVSVGALLQAVGSLPRLETFRMCAAPLPHGLTEAPWQQLVDHNPPRLRQVVLFSHMWDEDRVTAAGGDLHNRILALLQAGMPQHVQVCSSFGGSSCA